MKSASQPKRNLSISRKTGYKTTADNSYACIGAECGIISFSYSKLYEISIPWYNTHMQKAYRYRLCPTDEQTQMMTRIIGCCRFVYNRLLEYCSKSYKRRGESHTSFDLNNFICYSQESIPMAFRCTCSDPAVCFCRPLRSIQILLQEGCFSYPKYKSKHRSKKSFRVPQRGKVDEEGGRIYVQGVGWVDAVIHRKPFGKLKNITVTVNPSGTVYASCLFDGGNEAPAPSVLDNPKVVGMLGRQ